MSEKISNKKRKINFGFIAAFVFLLLLAISIYTNGFRTRVFIPPGPAEKVAQKAVNFINENNLLQGAQAILVSSNWEENGLCKFKIKVNDREFDSYISSDGKLLFPEAVDIEEFLAQEKTTQTESQSVSQEIPKRDKPDVKLFVMTYCPYGLQSQKTLLPVYNLLKDKADIKVYFVNYAMHGKKELDENLRQYCVQKEESEKYTTYLNCFVKEDKSDGCLSEAKINEAKLSRCVSETDKKYKVNAQYDDKNTWLSGRFPKFDVETDLNEKYNVQGSPTMVINDKVVNVERSPEKYKAAICESFEQAPEECSQTLSNKTPSPGFGVEETDSSSSGSCE